MKTQFEKDKKKMRSWYMTQAQLDAYCFEEQNKDATTFQAFLAGYFRAVAKHVDSEDGKLPIPRVSKPKGTVCPCCGWTNGHGSMLDGSKCPNAHR